MHKHIGIFNVTARVDMQCPYYYFISINNINYLVQLIDRHSKFTLLVTRRNFEIASCKNIGSYPNANRVSVSKFIRDIDQLLVRQTFWHSCEDIEEVNSGNSNTGVEIYHIGTIGHIEAHRLYVLSMFL